MLTLTDWKTGAPVLLETKDIGAIKEVKSIDPWDKAMRTHSYVFVITDSGIYDHMYEVREPPGKIGELILEPLFVAGEDIRET